jgi:hypothetical protein
MTPLDPYDEDRRWVGWRNELRGEKLTKVPYCGVGKKAKADDPTTWVSRADAERVAARIVNGLGGGIGYELGDLGNDLYCGGIDLDSCLDGEALADWAVAIIAAAATYGERSPSGRGLKLFFHVAAEHVRPFLDLISVFPEQWGCRRDVAGKDARDHGPAVEVYLSHRYFTVTGLHWPDLPAQIQCLDWDALERLATLIPPPKSAVGSSANRGGDNSRSAAAFRKGAALRRAGKTFEEMVAVLRSDPETAAWVREKGDAAGGRELRRIWEKAAFGVVSINDFRAYMPEHRYIFMPSGESWPGSSVNSRIPPVPVLDGAGLPVLGDDGKPIKLSAAAWLDRNRPVEQITWAPGLPKLITDRLTSEGGWIEHAGVTCFNLFRPALLMRRNAANAYKWVDHLHTVFPAEEGAHIEYWLAHRVQRPEEKINHALLLGGKEGIGKDTLLEPVKRAIGQWNWREVSPRDVIGRFNGFVKSIVLRINEARDLGEVNRFQFHDHMKSLIAAPPDVLRVDEKHLREYYVMNCCGVIITTNHKADGIYLPADDRRHFVSWSNLEKESFEPAYWSDLWNWYDTGGDRDVAAYLAELDLTKFNPKAPPPKTPAFWDIVNSNQAPEDAELADALDLLKNPDAVILDDLVNIATDESADWLKDRKNRRIIPHRLEACGYVPARNPSATDGLWKIRDRRRVVYVKAGLPLSGQSAAANKLTRDRNRSVSR